MELDLGVVVFAVCVIFVLGWVAAKYDLRQFRLSNKGKQQNFFKGLTLLLNEQQDQAIDAFINAVRNDPEAVELYFSLASLFSRRGDHSNAVKIHQHLLARADLSRQDRARASYLLAVDYLNAGILDRAEEILVTIKDKEYEQRALQALLNIYERTQEWDNAVAITKRLVAGGQTQVINRQAHYTCEQAQKILAGGDGQQALELLQQEIKHIPNNVRLHIMSGHIWTSQNNSAQAMASFYRAHELDSRYLGLYVGEFMQMAAQAGSQQQLLKLLLQEYQKTPTVDVAKVIWPMLMQTEKDAAMWPAQLQLKPSLILVQQMLDEAKFSDSKFFSYVQDSLQRNVRFLNNYRCQVCHFEAQDFYWHCPGCQSWESYLPYRVEDLN